MQEDMPGVLQPYMSGQDWRQFHAEMKVVLDPLSAWKQRQAYANIAFLCLFVIAFIGFAVSGFTNVNSFGGSGVSPFYFWIAFPICMLGFLAFQFYVRSQAQEAVDKIRRVVANVSRRHTALTFNVQADMFASLHRRHTRVLQNYFIEVSILGGQAAVPGQVVTVAANVVPAVAVEAATTPLMGLPVADSSAYAYAATSGMPPSAEQVQQTLQQIDDLYRSGLLSKSEYDAKRAEVLARI